MTMLFADWGAIIVSASGAYLCGSIPFGLIFAHWGGHGDIRDIGSGNIGATNVLRTGNKHLAAATLACDVAKGLIPVLIARQFGSDAATAAAIGAPLGHIFPVWLGFKGGKGVATAAGAVFAYAWPIALAAVLTWVIAAAVFRYSSLAAMMAVVVVVLYAWIAPPAGVAPSAVMLLGLLVLSRHRSNLARLLNGEEDKIALRKTRA